MQRWLEDYAAVAFSRAGDTAHDLKTPLNIAVLNLELLRMRLRKLSGGTADERVEQYARSIEVELRRMADIFDAYFIFSTPPKGEGDPQLVDLVALCDDAAITTVTALDAGAGRATTVAHEGRIRQAFRLFFAGVQKVLKPGFLSSTAERDGQFVVRARGTPATEEFEISKIFKFYYTDALGNPELSLATARLIAETYGGRLSARLDEQQAVLELSLPLGEE
jgi:signal transduction histidine kinase